MEVLKYNYNYNYLETKEITCCGCGSILRVIEEDIEEYNDKYYGVHYRRGNIKCPVCHSKTYIDWDEEID